METDFCVADMDSKVRVNGFVCKDPTVVKAEDFFSTGLDKAGDTGKKLGSNVTAVNVNKIVGLNTLGISMVRIDYAPKGLNAPHTHPRATEILTVIEGQLFVGFVTSNSDNGNRLFTKMLKKGDVFVFPEGLIHFQFNPGHTNTVAIGALSSQNPGTITIANAVFGSKPPISDEVLAKAFQVDKKTIDWLQAHACFSIYTHLRRAIGITTPIVASSIPKITRMAAKTLLLALLAVASSLAMASDPSPLQDFCVADKASKVLVNGFVCKDPKVVKAEDFFFRGLDKAGDTGKKLGSNVTAVNVNKLAGLNTLGISMVRIDYAPRGLNPPHTHPRATEILTVIEGQLFVGFVTSNSDNGNRLFTKMLKKGDVFVFPQGLIHFQFNPGYTNTVAIGALSSQNPGTITVADAVFGSKPPISDEVLAKAFQRWQPKSSSSLSLPWLPLSMASDPSPLQDFCVADKASKVLVNGFVCKDPMQVTAEDFFAMGLDKAGNTENKVGSMVTAVNVNKLAGLNTLGISMVRIDYAPRGLNPPHTHPRATEILTVIEGQLLVGFVTSNTDNGNRLFTKMLKKGDVFVFPEGLIHFQFNPGHTKTVAIGALSSQNPGTITIANAVFGSKPPISDDVLAKAFQVDKKTVDWLQAHPQMAAKILLIALLALASSHALASDPSPLQDFCVADMDSKVRVNGFVCKDPTVVKAEDFFSTGLDKAGDTGKKLGSNVTAVNVNKILGLNTLGISMATTLHTHPRATEILTVIEGQLFVGFVTSNSDNGNRLFTKMLKKGDVFVFPEGLIHFQFNPGHTNTVAIGALSSQNPGTITIANAVFGSKPPISDEVLAKAFQVDKKTIDWLQAQF
ncbi:germin-like protein [Musa troglodytarum]|uniref:Germin-like protein n=1 Tax=Musa troglodytarum TaxID=320322 RepID=A0A9E7K6Q0_9LILI|nr:germin-like protein [Musa troglodytarum]